ncbi:MAG: phospholipid-binding protein MlaC [Rickettsiaceae bacterium]|nr:MAG: phospholipid-binding protein MlaC [Rickettsiaceae bacterium]
MKKLFILLTVLAVPTTFAAAPPNSSKGIINKPSISKPSVSIDEYVTRIVDEASKLLSDSQISESQKISQSRKLMANNLDLEWMAEHSLGRHKKNLSSAQISQFGKIYSDYVIKTYSNLISNYKGQKTIVKRVIQLVQGKEYLVKTEVIQNGQPVKVDYLVRYVSQEKTNEIVPKISDIITEDISILHSQQQEFSSVINSKGFDTLITELKQKS